MAIISEEWKEKLFRAESADEAAELMKAAGQEISPEDAERLWQELGRRGIDAELSLDELEAVSGGVRDWVTEGCAATVECGSMCWSDDNCIMIYEHYSNSPISITCPKCGTNFYKSAQRSSNLFAKVPIYYICKTCGYSEFAYYELA